MAEITRLIEQSATDPTAFELLCSEIHTQLVSLARARLRREPRRHILMETMDLVSESWPRLVRSMLGGVKDRAHFFRLYVLAMERVLCDHARAQLGPSRGGSRARVEIHEDDWITLEQAHEIVCVKEVLDLIEAEYPSEASIVKALYFGGLESRQAVELLRDEPSFRTLDERDVDQALKFVKGLVRERLEGGRGGRRHHA